MSNKKKLVAAIACRNDGTRLYAKPLQNLDYKNGIKIIDNIIDCLKTISVIDEIVLGISDKPDNEIYKIYAKDKNLKFITGDDNDVLSRLISCGNFVNATDIFRVTSESPFIFFENIYSAWDDHILKNVDATFMDDIIDGCGFEIIKLEALEKSHIHGNKKHRSELCTLYIRENAKDFKINKIAPPKDLIRNDLRLTVDYPEDLVLCRHIYQAFKDQAPKIPIRDIVNFLDMDENKILRESVVKYTEQGYSTMYL